jgi:Flp pilus assembly protein protease CpaA
MLAIASAIALFALVVASYCDIRTREVPDWLNYSLIAAGLAIGIIASLAYNTWTYAAFSIAGLLIFVGIAFLMFYAGQWGGGDSKLLMGLGAIVGLEFSTAFPFLSVNNFLFAFWINTLLAGVVYALLWSIALAIKHRKTVSAKFDEEIEKKKPLRFIVFAATIIFTVISLFIPVPQASGAILLMAAIIFFSFYALMLVKAVEKSCMFKLMLPEQLTEGDWIARDIVVKGKYICGPKDLGIEKRQIAQLKKLYSQKKVTRILVKEGIPFVPSFLAGFILTLLFGNFLFSFI